jgi:Restriction endonuclease
MPTPRKAETLHNLHAAKPKKLRGKGRPAVKPSKSFEQQIHRVYEFLEGSGVQVTWDDHIPDPDNPCQPRQIDITIKRDGKLTLVECRHHRSRQNVKWIEEMMGRRVSLKADSAIAVSSSGFTSGALRKAKKHGIVTRDLRELTEREIRGWGRQIALTLYFYEYSELELSLYLECRSMPKLDMVVFQSEIAAHAVTQSLFNSAAQQLGTMNPLKTENAEQTMEFNLLIELPGFRLCGQLVRQVRFRGKAALIAQDVVSPAVLAYGNPDDDPAQREIKVENFSLGRTSIIHDAERISILLDVSQVEVAPCWQFRFFRVTGSDEIEHESLELVGVERLLAVRAIKMRVNVLHNRA